MSNIEAPQMPNAERTKEVDARILIAIRPMKAAKSRDQYEGIKAKASDVHDWPNRLDI